MPPVIRAARPGDHAAIAMLLRANDLPLDGVPPSGADFLVAEQDGGIVGVVGLERFGTHALLRSAAVDAAVRGTGLGARLVAGVLDLAAQRGVEELWLLTTTAERWFPRFGFAVAARADVPPAVQASPEFQGACPSTATVMRLAGTRRR